MLCSMCIRILDHSSHFMILISLFIWVFLPRKTCVSGVEVVYHLSCLDEVGADTTVLHSILIRMQTTTHSSRGQLLFLIIKLSAQYLLHHKLRKSGLVLVCIYRWNFTTFCSFYKLFVESFDFFNYIKLLKIIDYTYMVDIVATGTFNSFS